VDGRQEVIAFPLHRTPLFGAAFCFLRAMKGDSGISNLGKISG
jgi:hypothetical protein